MVDRFTVRSSLQKCITWTKKSKTLSYLDECVQSREYDNQGDVDAVKKRSFPIIVMMKMILLYKSAGEKCFGSQANLSLGNFVPVRNTFEIVKLIVEALVQLIFSCLHSQKKYWGINNAIASNFEGSFLHESRCTTIIPVDENYFEGQLKNLKVKMSKVVCSTLGPLLTPFFGIEDINGCYPHQYIALIIDPVHSDWKEILMKLYPNMCKLDGFFQDNTMNNLLYHCKSMLSSV